MNINPFPNSFKSVVSDPFYKRLDPVQSASLINSPKPKKGRVTLPFLNDEVLISLHKRSKLMQTGDIPKQLAVYNEYLVWFSANTSKVQIRSPPPLLSLVLEPTADSPPQQSPKPNSAEFPLVEGYAEIQGFFVQTNETVDAFLSDSLRLLGDFRSRQILVPGAKDEEGLKISPAALKHGDPAPNHMQHQTFLSKSKYYFRFQRNTYESFVETIFFDTEEEAAMWREQLAAAPVFFGDFYSRYKILNHISKEGKNKMIHIQLKGTGDPLLSRYRTLTNFHDKADLESVKNEFLREAMILFRLNPMNITAKLHEMHYANHSFFFVEDQIHCVPFADWFVDTWGFEHDNIRELSSVYRLLGDLTQLVLTMTDFDVSHCNLNKYTILVNTYMMKSPQTASRLLQQKKTVKGFSSLYFQALKKNSKNQTGHLTNLTEEETLMSKRGSPLVQKHRFFLTSFGEAVDTMINMIGPKHKKPAGSPRKQGRYTTFAKRHAATSEDVLKLGFIFCEVLYGIDIPKALQQKYGLDSQFASEVVSRPQFALFSRDPLYDVDQSFVEVLAGMLDPDPTKRPTIREVFDMVQMCIREYQNPERARSTKPRNSQVGARDSFISRLSFEPQTPLSAFHKRRHFRDKPGDSGSTQFNPLDLLARSPAPFKVVEASSLDESSPQRSALMKFNQVFPDKADVQFSQTSSFKQKAGVRVEFGSRIFQSSQPMLANEAVKFLDRRPAKPSCGFDPGTKGSGRQKRSIFERISNVFGDQKSNQMQKVMLTNHNTREIIKLKVPQRNASPALSNISSNKMAQVCINGREYFREENKAKRVILPANNSEIDLEFCKTFSNMSRSLRVPSDSPKRSPSLNALNSRLNFAFPQDLGKLGKPFRKLSLKLTSNISRERISPTEPSPNPWGLRRDLNLKLSRKKYLPPTSSTPRLRYSDGVTEDKPKLPNWQDLFARRSENLVAVPTSRRNDVVGSLTLPSPLLN